MPELVSFVSCTFLAQMLVGEGVAEPQVWSLREGVIMLAVCGQSGFNDSMTEVPGPQLAALVQEAVAWLEGSDLIWRLPHQVSSAPTQATTSLMTVPSLHKDTKHAEPPPGHLPSHEQTAGSLQQRDPAETCILGSSCGVEGDHASEGSGARRSGSQAKEGNCKPSTSTGCLDTSLSCVASKRKQELYASTQLGQAVVASGMSPEEALVVYQDLVAARQAGVVILWPCRVIVLFRKTRLTAATSVTPCM